MRRGSVVAAVLVGVLAACGGSGAQLAASTDPQSLQQKMAIVQAQFKAEQEVLDQNEDAILNIVSGGGGGNADTRTIFDLLEDPSSFFDTIGGAAESVPPETLAAAWAAHAEAWCALDPSAFDDDFFLIYGGPHVLASLVAFLDSACGHDHAAALVDAARARDLGQGMAASGVPGSGISLDALLDRLDGSRGD